MQAAEHLELGNNQTDSKVGGSNHLKDELDVKVREGDTCFRFKESRQGRPEERIRTAVGWLHT